jgi:hypothetical protein
MGADVRPDFNRNKAPVGGMGISLTCCGFNLPPKQLWSISVYMPTAALRRTPRDVSDGPIPDSCTAANDVRRTAVILLDVHFEPGQFYLVRGGV